MLKKNFEDFKEMAEDIGSKYPGYTVVDYKGLPYLESIGPDLKEQVNNVRFRLLCLIVFFLVLFLALFIYSIFLGNLKLSILLGFVFGIVIFVLVTTGIGKARVARGEVVFKKAVRTLKDHRVTRYYISVAFTENKTICHRIHVSKRLFNDLSVGSRVIVVNNGMNLNVFLEN